ncbi:hypothetical protein JI735_04945 [Paenibacillus sonchi]|uniref:Uncharacterized protein n=1 Tax=Paenibacillus sonchi TaxID=373687 RepID=A0A974PDW7_9BACL|nr:hypothetical protein [Paenibacillus sonchi]QQZ62026.1 hypothetical protein JI735_04945 [Paenibacillus sonchi]
MAVKKMSDCDFYQQPNIECRSSYGGLVLPQMKEKMLNELKVFLLKSLEHVYTDNEKNMFFPIFAQINIEQSAG